MDTSTSEPKHPKGKKLLLILEATKYLIPAIIVLLTTLYITRINKEEDPVSMIKCPSSNNNQANLAETDTKELKNRIEELQRENHSLKQQMPEIFQADLNSDSDSFKKYIVGDIKSGNITFTIDYPTEWIRDFSVFEDNAGNKIAELLPVVENVAEDTCSINENFDTYQGRLELISRKAIKIKDLEGTYTLWTSIPEGNPSQIRWYANSYCLRGKEKYTDIIFYEYQEIPQKQDLYNQILNSIILK